MAILKIVKYGERILEQPTKKVDFSLISQATLGNMIKDMLETMYAGAGIGLAANQVGLGWQVLVLDLKIDGKKNPLALINPVIQECSNEKETMEEGCLSFPGIQIPVPRFVSVRVRATGRDGKPLDFVAEGLFARVIQHEYDHLQGKVFIRHLPFFKKLSVLAEIRRRKKSGDW